MEVFLNVKAPVSKPIVSLEILQCVIYKPFPITKPDKKICWSFPKIVLLGYNTLT